jgi:hypothetical protein
MAVCYTVGYRQTTQTCTCRGIRLHMAVGRAIDSCASHPEYPGL